MKYIDKHTFTTYEIKKSKFISHLVPFDMFDEMMSELKATHPKARHFVYASRYLNEWEQIVENSSDDGEPKGTSGKPTLSVLAGADMINCAVITVRYFGGVKLGTGGLVKAYSDSANLVLHDENSIIKEYIKLEDFVIECKYSELRELEYNINKIDNSQINIIKKEFNDKVKLHIKTTDENFKRLSLYFI
jgi:uncharacterized YigZ family protein